MQVSLTRVLMSLCAATSFTQAEDAPRADWQAVASGYEVLAPQRNPFSPRRTEDLYALAGALTQRVREYGKSIPPAETWGGDSAEFRSKLDGAIRGTVPLAIAARDDGRSSVEAIGRAAEQDCLDYLATTTAFQAAMTDVSVRLLPAYVPSTDGIADAPLRMIAAVGPHLQQQIANEMRTRGIVVTPERLGDVSLGIASVLRSEAEKKIVQEVVVLRVEPRIDQSSAMTSPEVVAKAKAFLRAQVGTIVEEPFSPARIDRWAQQLTGEVRGILAGGEVPKVASPTSTPLGSRPGSSPGLPGQTGANARGPRVAMKPTIVANNNVNPNQPLVGMSIHNRKGRKITIPQGSHGNAHLLTGVECEIGGKGGAPAMFNLIYDWRGPNSSKVPLRNLRVIGQATAMPGPERVSVTLNSLSYVFPSGRAISVPVSGYVVDSVEGIEGMMGSFNWNATKVMPYAVVSGGLQGFSEALRSNSTVTVVGEASTTFAQTGDQLENALYAGLGEGAGIMADYVKRVLQDIKPSISVRNGQKVTMILTQPVSFDVPEEEWDVLTNPDSFDNYSAVP